MTECDFPGYRRGWYYVTHAHKEGEPDTTPHFDIWHDSDPDEPLAHVMHPDHEIALARAQQITDALDYYESEPG